MITCNKLLSFVVCANLLNLVLLHICGLLEHIDKALSRLVWHQVFVKIVKVNYHALLGVLYDLEVAVGIKKVSNRLCRNIPTVEIWPELDPDDVLVSGFTFESSLIRFGRIQMVAHTVVKLIQHYLVFVSLPVLVLHIDRLIFHSGLRFDLLFLLFVLFVTLFVSASLLSFLFFVVEVVHLFVLENFGVTVASHESIIGCLMIMLEQLASLIVFESVFQIKFKPQDVLQSLICLTFLIDLTKDSLAEVVRLKRQHFCVKSARKPGIPLLDKLLIGLGQGSYKLIVKVNDIVDHIVSNKRNIGVILERFYHFLDNN